MFSTSILPLFTSRARPAAMDAADDVEVLEESLAELLARESKAAGDKWHSALRALERVETLYAQAEYNFWTLGVLKAYEGDTCPLLGCAFENSGAVVLNATSTPISFTYLVNVMQRAREALQGENWGSQYHGEVALKLLQDPYTRLPIMLIQAVRVYDTSGVEVVGLE